MAKKRRIRPKALEPVWRFSPDVLYGAAQPDTRRMYVSHPPSPEPPALTPGPVTLRINDGPPIAATLVSWGTSRSFGDK